MLTVTEQIEMCRKFFINSKSAEKNLTNVPNWSALQKKKTLLINVDTEPNLKTYIFNFLIKKFLDVETVSANQLQWENKYEKRGEIQPVLGILPAEHLIYLSLL